MIVCCCRQGLTWTLFLLLQISAIGLVVASVLVPDWVSSTNFSSGLYECSDISCAKSNYSDEANLMCDSNSSSSDCKLYRGLEYGMMAYLRRCGSNCYYSVDNAINLLFVPKELLYPWRDFWHYCCARTNCWSDHLCT